MMRAGNGWWSCVGGVLALVCAAATASAQEKPAAPGQMNMADHRGALSGRVRNAAGAAVADTEVLAISAENGAEFRSTTDAQGNYSFGALPVGKYDVTLASAGGLITFRRGGVDIAMDGKV
ncbi:MAG TPA: carboxypeptidase-like regulatory domain-containing protein, partial [Vicinamibacterales bacterium]|nr:carboxypeptidase-like regulatory domain-containing protein [Vicinamibacterales bacterium]